MQLCTGIATMALWQEFIKRNDHILHAPDLANCFLARGRGGVFLHGKRDSNPEILGEELEVFERRRRSS